MNALPADLTRTTTPAGPGHGPHWCSPIHDGEVELTRTVAFTRRAFGQTILAHPSKRAYLASAKITVCDMDQSVEVSAPDSWWSSQPAARMLTQIDGRSWPSTRKRLHDAGVRNRFLGNRAMTLMVDITEQDLRERVAANLRRLINEHFGGNVSAFGRAAFPYLRDVDASRKARLALDDSKWLSCRSVVELSLALGVDPVELYRPISRESAQ